MCISLFFVPKSQSHTECYVKNWKDSNKELSKRE